MDFKKLKKEIEDASQQCFSVLRNKYSKDNICAYSLYSDADAISISPAINTKEYLLEMSAGDPDDSIYYKWSPAEWKHEFEGAEFFEDISKALQEEAKKMNTQGQFLEFKKNVYEACVESLESLIKNNFFSKDSNDCIIIFTLSDTEDSINEIKWVERLNNEQKAHEFSNWVNGG